MTSDIGKTRVSFQRFTLRLSFACFVLLFTPVHADPVPALGTYHWPNGTAGVDAFAGWLGLAFWTKFAKEHGKPLAIPEWGLVWSTHNHGGLDDVHFIEQMHAFITDPKNDVAFHCYFDINESDHGHQLSPGVEGTGKEEGTKFPKSAARFRELFSLKR